MMQTGIIQFQGNQLLTVRDESNGRVYVAMKPVVENIGLSWGEQLKKIKSDSRYSVITIPFKTKGGIQEMLSLPTDQLAGFLYSINPNKVKKSLRAKVLSFQKETFNVINDYWNNKFTVKTGTSQDHSLLHENYTLAQEVIRLKDMEIEFYKKQSVTNALPDGVNLPRRGMYLDEDEKLEIAKLWKEKHSIAEMMRITGRSDASIKKYRKYKRDTKWQ